MSVLTPRNLVTALLAAAVIGLGTVVAVDHTAGSATPAPATATSAHVANAQPLDTLATKAGGPMRILQWLSQETGVPTMQIISDVQSGKTLAQIAGSKAAKLKADVLGYVSDELGKAVSRGAISAGDETRLLADASDAIDVLMNAKVGALYAGQH